MIKTKQEAWNVVAQATSQYKGTREEHETIKQALLMLQPEKDKPKENKVTYKDGKKNGK